MGSLEVVVDAAGLAAEASAAVEVAPPSESGGASSGLGLNQTAPPLSQPMNERMMHRNAFEQ